MVLDYEWTPEDGFRLRLPTFSLVTSRNYLTVNQVTYPTHRQHSTRPAVGHTCDRCSGKGSQ